jgi:hypothetical protein
LAAVRWVLAFLLVAVPACNREARARHEALGRELERPFALLCSTQHLEGGGCHADCQTRLAASDGHAAVEAGRGFASMATNADGETEALLARVRARGGELVRALERECPVAIPANAAITPELQRCADARRREGRRISELFASVASLAERTNARVGTELPSACPRN